MTAEPAYVLGHNNPEVERLLLQGRLYDPHTEQALRLAGLEPGMRVLDVGSGPGDVSFAAARIVGPAGSVTGVDAEPSIVALANARATERRLSTVSFRQGRIEDLSATEPYDAVIGRLILMHLPDPVAAVRGLARLVRPGGVVTFQDFDVTATRTMPELPLFSHVRDLIIRSFRAAGAEPSIGTMLHSVFVQAGLPAPRLTLGGYVGSTDDPDVLGFIAGVWRAMRPVAERLGTEIDPDADLDILPERLRAHDALVVLPELFSAWTRLPGGT